jgi:hypothetical protein
MTSAMVLTDKQTEYLDLSEIGTVTIGYADGRVSVRVEGFEFEQADSCRVHATKALRWARDILNRQIEAEKLAPGGTIICSCD